MSGPLPWSLSEEPPKPPPYVFERPEWMRDGNTEDPLGYRYGCGYGRLQWDAAARAKKSRKAAAKRGK